MGKRGPKPTPTKEKERLGNPGKRPLNKAEPEPTGDPIKPDYLDDYAGLVWDRVIRSMAKGVYTACDTGILTAYCQAESIHRQATIVNQKGRYQAYKDGDITESMYRDTTGKDWIRIQKESAASIVSLGTNLGLNPPARAAIKVPDKPTAGKFGGLRAIK